MIKTDFNRGWLLEKEGSTEALTVNLPYDAMLYETRSEKAAGGSAGAFFPGGKYRFSKKLTVSEEELSQVRILEFEGIYQNSEVILNGGKLCGHPYGYTGFFVDLSGKLKAGENEIIVIADNSKLPNSRWYSGSGIYREVFLYSAGREYILPEGLCVRTVDGGRIHVTLETENAENCRAVISVYDGEKQAARGEGFDIEIFIPEAKLWDDGHPYLYRCEAKLLREDGSVADTAETRFGVRTLSWGGDGLLVNGRSVLLRGSCIHHDNGILGACAFRDAEYRRIRILKEAGFNAIRSAHNPASKALLDACDELGMYVMDETFDMWSIHKNPYDYASHFADWWQRDTEAMIRKDYNHPSVILYSIGNEISELGFPDGRELAGRMADHCRSLDASRPVTAGVNLGVALMAKFSAGGKKKDEAPFAGEEGKDETKNVPTSEFFNSMMQRLGNRMDKVSAKKASCRIADSMSGILDIPGYNYATARYTIDAEKRPQQATVGSETLPMSLYRNWKLVESIPTMIGDFMWTGWDYLGEAGIGVVRYIDKKTKRDTEPGLIISGGPGIIDICGKMRPEVGWSRLIWGLQDKPVIGVCPFTHAGEFSTKRIWRTSDTVGSWSWAGCEGKKSDVYVYAAAPKAELVINGKSQGIRKTKEYTAVFSGVAYEAGTVEAIARDESGRELSRTALHTAAGEARISLSAETNELRANGQDLCFLNIALTGEDGTVLSSCDRKLTLEVSGAGQLQGFGSAQPCMAENFVSMTHTTFYGRALAVIRAGYESGSIRVRVSGEGLESKEIQIPVQIA